MADWPDAQENPFKVTPGHGSDVTTTSAASSSRRPDPAMHPISVVSLLPWATTAATEEAGILKYELWSTGTTGARMLAKIPTVWFTEDKFTAFLHSLLSNTSGTPDICSASDLCSSFHVFFIYLCSSPVYLLLSRLSRWPRWQISLVGAAALPCLF